jgi:hypothetical protein
MGWQSLGETLALHNFWGSTQPLYHVVTLPHCLPLPLHQMLAKSLVAALLCVVVASAAPHAEFDAWAKAHGKTYTSDEYLMRSAIYASNVAKITAHNAAGYTWTMAVNQFADLTSTEVWDGVYTFTPGASQPVCRGGVSLCECSCLLCAALRSNHHIKSLPSYLTPTPSTPLPLPHPSPLSSPLA